MARKSRPSANPTPELSRELSLFHIIMMGLGMMIGAGVFLGMGISIGEAGPGGVVLTFALNGVFAMLTAMSFAELSSAIPRAGGVYNFARIGFGRNASFLAGWMEWFASSVAGSMYALTFAIYSIRFIDALGWLNPLYESFGNDPETVILVLERLTAVITAGLFVYINFKGSSETGKAGAVITVGQTLFVLTIGIFGVVAVIQDPSRLQNFTPFMPEGWSKLLVTMGFTYVAFEGYEVIAQAGDETIDPKKNLPKAMIYSVTIVTLIYVLVAFATVVSVKAGSEGVGQMPPWEWIGQFKEKGFGEAAARLMPLGNFVLTLAVIFSSTSALNATIYSGTRASYALGRDGMMPEFWSRIHEKNRTPYGALIATSVIVIFTAAFLPTEDVASSASIMFLFLFFMVNLCVIKIRLGMGDELEYGFMMPFFPVPPILALIMQAVLAVWLVHMSVIAWIIAPIWILAGLAIYLLYSKDRVIAAEHEITVFDEQRNYKPKGYPVMVGLADPENAVDLVNGTYKLCSSKKKPHVELIHMVSVPEHISLSESEEYTEPGREAITEAMLYLSMHFPLNTTIRYCRNIARGIVSAVKEKKVKLLVLGWHGKPENRLFNIGATIDPIVERAPCNVVIIKGSEKSKQRYKSVLVPVSGGPNSEYAAEIANIMAETDAKVTMLKVDTGQKRGFKLREFALNQAMRLRLRPDRFTTKTVKAKSSVIAILREAKNHELTVLGMTNRPLGQFRGLSVPEKIACRTSKPVVIAKAGGKVDSLFKRIFS
ncbi:putative amino acid permease YhdG [Sedimentisphaera cyanobacteriorum]|uniref:Putative amino acid permease YhdG n=1 Tax=Sedimentisphaera cyanobacteriorum TaxID=1940790 RepID=A0A1Q2HS42_9BACT|nr:amino acid permease [Sedimentisphaera cyanobacteriorum]AQQ10055.1 putative amino acid permease YhdG [Sedimentisphaera cyanobacteriorum]